MQIDFEGRLRNTNLPISKPLLPLFDAIINSIDAIEESGFSDESTINVIIEREQNQQVLIGDD
jgi:mannitol/fructose-specific phosphotransferase system IIA component